MGISVSIVAGPDESSSSVTASGSVQHVITDKERKTFKLEDRQLKNAVNAYFGKSPNDAFLCSPTPWDDLYRRYDWPQVQMILEVQSAQILSIESNPKIVKTQTFRNRSARNSGEFDCSITSTVETSATSTWSTGGELTIEQSFSYKVGVPDAGVEGETTLSYMQSWGVGGEHSQKYTVGSTSGLMVTLEPGEEEIATISASEGKMKVRIRYRAYLTGYTALNYNPKHRNHHFHALPIEAVMAAGGISNSLEFTEDIEVGYYSNSEVILGSDIRNAPQSPPSASPAVATATSKPTSPQGTTQLQKDWRWCRKCEALFYSGGKALAGKCPGGGQHEHQGSGNYTLSQDASVGQKDWRWCHKCEALFYSGGKASAGKCPGGGQHEHQGSGNYALSQNPSVGQKDWRWCHKCEALFYSGGKASAGKCPGGGLHEHQGSGNYVLSHL
ncbi:MULTISPECIES: hypothetical protein [Cyanophyceae]|uniref:Uncharacterized protein n=1 Tax=Leptolyngbya subtilissima DQ-A4 TaxID=2933933 RepID=A0ABV0K4Z5_9CYAN|nr:hypothetical protein [Nodosilinea sp. FACHB-141]MBD2113564.1 hypothetical protein [Nodosilinea sp. FACHB-141]